MDALHWFALLSTLAAVLAVALVVRRAVAGARRWKQEARSRAETAPAAPGTGPEGTKMNGS